MAAGLAGWLEDLSGTDGAQALHVLTSRSLATPPLKWVSIADWRRVLERQAGRVNNQAGNKGTRGAGRRNRQTSQGSDAGG